MFELSASERDEISTDAKTELDSFKLLDCEVEPVVCADDTCDEFGDASTEPLSALVGISCVFAAFVFGKAAVTANAHNTSEAAAEQKLSAAFVSGFRFNTICFRIRNTA